MTISKYATRLETRMVRDHDFPYNREVLDGTTAVLDFVKVLQDSDIEKMIVLHLNSQNRLNCIQIFPGTINQAVVYPRELIKISLLSSSNAMILVHNHPSGNLKPSDADIRLTTMIREGCKTFDILFHDHLIIEPGGTFFSWREEGLI